jgi:hypothetical protein
VSLAHRMRVMSMSNRFACAVSRAIVI